MYQPRPTFHPSVLPWAGLGRLPQSRQEEHSDCRANAEGPSFFFPRFEYLSESELYNFMTIMGLKNGKWHLTTCWETQTSFKWSCLGLWVPSCIFLNGGLLCQWICLGPKPQRHSFQKLTVSAGLWEPSSASFNIIKFLFLHVLR